MDKAEWPQRECREPVSPDGMIDHWCDLPELHPGPHAPSTLTVALERREQWEAANPGWEKMHREPDPFADFTTQMRRVPPDVTVAPRPNGQQAPGPDGKAPVEPAA